MSEEKLLPGSRKGLMRTTFVALFAALTAAGTFIAIPVPLSPVPVVLQNLFALLSGLILGPLLGAAAVGSYLLVGAIGAPVFAGAKGGIAHFFGPTGGYLFGYLLCAIVAGLVAGKPKAETKTALWRIALAAVLGIAAVYVPGPLRLSVKLGGDWNKTVSAGLLPFLVGDAAKIIVAAAVAPRLRRVAADRLDG